MKYRKIVQAMISALSAYRRGCTWEVSTDGRTYTKGKLPYKFEGAGEHRFRTTLAVPADIAGVPVGGTPLRLRCFMTLPTKVFADGKLIFDEEYWTDFQLPEVTICEKAYPGDSVRVEIHVTCTPSIEATGEEMEVSLYSDAVEDLAFRLEAFLAGMDFLAGLGAPQEECAEKAFLSSLDDEKKADDVEKAAQRAMRAVAARSLPSKNYTVHLIGHAHMDMNWLWPQEETNRMIIRDFSTVCDLLDKHPDLTFTQSQGVTYEVANRIDPDLYDRVRTFIHDGRWETAASTWTEGDLNLADGESIARHIRITRAHMRAATGETSRLLWEPDTFGHPATVPQIMAKSGIDYYYHFRCGSESPLYLWEGNDGSTVPAFNSIYLNPIDPGKVVSLALLVSEKAKCVHTPFVYGVGDHGGGPTEREINRGRYLDSLPMMPRFEFSTMSKFFDQALAQSSPPTVSGELNPVFDGCYTTHAETKRLHRKCESLLQQAERAALLTGHSADTHLERLWKVVLFNQFHDILCGCGITETYIQADSELREVEEQALSFIKNVIGPGQSAIYNLEVFEREDVIALPPEAPRDQFVCQEVEGVDYTTISVPGPGSFSVSEHAQKIGTPCAGVKDLGDRLRLQSAYFEMDIAKESGIIYRLFDTTTNTPYIEPAVWRDEKLNMANNRFSIDYESPHAMSAWVIGPIVKTEHLLYGAEVRTVSDGPVMQIIEVVHRTGRSTIKERIYLYRHLPWIDFDIDVDWLEVSNDKEAAPSLKLSFMPELESTGVSTWEIPFGCIQRNNDGTEYPALRWIDISDDKKGFTLLNTATHGYSVHGTTIRATCLRTSYGPDPVPDKGRHRLGFRLIPHTGPCDAPQAARWGIGFNRPLIFGDPLTAPSMFNLESMSAVVTGLYADPDLKNAAIVRIVDYGGVASSISVDLFESVTGVHEVSLGGDIVFSELPVTNGRFSDTLKPFEIKTYRLTTSAPSPTAATSSGESTSG